MRRPVKLAPRTYCDARIFVIKPGEVDVNEFLTTNDEIVGGEMFVV